MKIRKRRSHSRAFTLAEVVIATGLSALAVGGTLYGYVMAVRRAEWSAHRLAAHSLAAGRVEQARAAKWDPLGYPPVDELVSSNFPVTVSVLDIPITRTNIAYATNVTTISLISTNPPLKMIRVDTSWIFPRGRAFTNTIVTYRAPDQ